METPEARDHWCLLWRRFIYLFFIINLEAVLVLIQLRKQLKPNHVSPRIQYFS